MSEAAVQAFLDRLGQDRGLAEEYRAMVTRAMQDAVGSAVVDLAAAHGSEISVEDLQAYWNARSGELDDDQLDAVSGGNWANIVALLQSMIAQPIAGAIAIPFRLDDGDDAS